MQSTVEKVQIFLYKEEFGLGSVDKVKFMTVITLDDYNKVAKN